METDVHELPLHENEVADTYKLVITGMSDDGYEATQSFMNRAEMDGTDEGIANVGLRRVRQNAETHVKNFIRKRPNSSEKADKVLQRARRERERRYGVKWDNASSGSRER